MHAASSALAPSAARAPARPGGDVVHRQTFLLPRCRHTQHQLRHSPRSASVQDAAEPAAAQQPGSSYDWSWSADGDGPANSSLPAEFEAAHPIPGGELSVQDLQRLLQAAADSGAQPSAAWLTQLCSSSTPALNQLSAPAAVQLLPHLARLRAAPPQPWTASLLERAQPGLPQLPPPALASLVWSLSNARDPPPPGFVSAALSAAAAQLPEFYAPDLCTLVCGAGALAADAPPPPGWLAALLPEVQFQLREFVADFGAFDLARLASGLADLQSAAAAATAAPASAASDASGGAGAGVVVSDELRRWLIKAVYMKTRTIQEKAAVDFALAKLDAQGARSMHFDPRWTHEELSWLPRRERDKRRILKEGWYRSKWAGWRSGE